MRINENPKSFAKRKIFRVLSAAAVLIISAIFMLGGCSYTEKERYMNFLADLDLVSRFDLCFDAAEKGKTDIYTASELEVLKQDILSYINPNEETRLANEYLTATAEELSECIEYKKTGDTDNYKLHFERALEHYAQANAKISAVKSGAENV